MPLGFERLNARVAQPNPLINFIKPLPGPDSAIAQDFLERIAAICSPIMKTHHVAVMALDEYENNAEFIGRNFNHGEVIQLVLKNRSGQWLPFRFVQMVMMHELAHCKQMNHSKAFWQVRNGYADELRGLWERGYSGEGMWSRGITLHSGNYANDGLVADGTVPEHLCGGTFQSRRRRKRKVKEKVSYKERQQRKIAKKFGTNGMALGADETTKVKLENGKVLQGKPRVAGSARGRELRAAAALARFDVKKEEPDVKEEDTVSGSETESDYEEGPKIKTEPNDALDLDGRKLLDSKGNGMVKVCEDEDKDDDDARNEMAELFGGDRGNVLQKSTQPEPNDGGKQTSPGTSVDISRHTAARDSSKHFAGTHPTPEGNDGNSTTAREDDIHRRKPSVMVTASKGSMHTKSSTQLSAATSSALRPTTAEEMKVSNSPVETESTISPATMTPEVLSSTDPSPKSGSQSRSNGMKSSCPVCSMENTSTALTCAACANVLDIDSVVGAWRCNSRACKGGVYINAGDCGVCGVCGARKSS